MEDVDPILQTINEDGDLVMSQSPPAANTKNVIEGDTVEKNTNNKRVRRSNVWKHFTKIGKVDGGKNVHVMVVGVCFHVVEALLT